VRHHEHDVDRRDRNRRRWFRVRALLAGGLVLGIGSAATMAAWNDGEYADTTLRAGTFQIEGSAPAADSGSTFTDHATSGTAATLTFSAPVTALSPGTTTYSSFFVRTKSTSVAGTVALQTPTFTASSTGLQSTLTYGVRLLASGQTCGAGAFSSPLGTAVVPTGTVLNAPLTAATQPIAAAGGLHHYCFALTLPSTADNSVQGQSATPVWQFLATAT
jgi:predicted ribosomally synthesized peptide with SipW-like signal peptide